MQRRVILAPVKSALEFSYRAVGVRFDSCRSMRGLGFSPLFLPVGLCALYTHQTLFLLVLPKSIQPRVYRDVYGNGGNPSLPGPTLFVASSAWGELAFELAFF